MSSQTQSNLLVKPSSLTSKGLNQGLSSGGLSPMTSAIANKSGAGGLYGSPSLLSNISNWYNTKSLGSYSNPKSPNYIVPGNMFGPTGPKTSSGAINGVNVASAQAPNIKNPSSLPTVQNANNSFMKGTMQGSMGSGLTTGSQKTASLPQTTLPTGTPPPVAPPVNMPPVAPPAVPPQTAFETNVQKIGNQDNSQYNQDTQQSIQNQNSAAQGNQQYQDRAKEIADRIAKEYYDRQQSGIGQAMGEMTTGTSPVGEGNARLTAQATGQLLQGISQRGQMELTGNAQGLTGQSQQQSGYNNAGNLAQTGQGTTQSALSTAGQLSQTHFNGYVGMDPITGKPLDSTGASSAAFGGGQVGARENQGGVYQTNDATLQILTGQDGNSGMVGSFNSTLTQAGTNSGTTNLGNALKQGLNVNTSGPYASLQNNFQNILAQYAKILGPQTVNTLMTSSNNKTISQFFQDLTKQAQQVQSGLKNSGTGINSNSQSIDSLRAKYNY